MYRAQGAFISECEGVKTVEFSYSYSASGKIDFSDFLQIENKSEQINYILFNYLPMGKV